VDDSPEGGASRETLIVDALSDVFRMLDAAKVTVHTRECQFAASWDQAEVVFRRVMGPPLLQAEGTTRGEG
jgi:hypothetical protein